jgi:hypothetical protein
LGVLYQRTSPFNPLILTTSHPRPRTKDDDDDEDDWGTTLNTYSNLGFVDRSEKRQIFGKHRLRYEMDSG